jgi:hypothetical protein
LLTSSPIPVISVLCASDTVQASHLGVAERGGRRGVLARE